MNPKTIDELIPPNAKARAVWRLVEQLDLTALYDEIKSVEGHAGRPAVEPKILVALWIYATDEHIASAHVVAKRTKDCDPYRWICGGVPVSYHTLSDFRVEHLEWLSKQVVDVVAAMRQENQVSLNNIGQDGMRVRANAGSDSFHTAEELSQLLDQAQEQWNHLQQEFERNTDLSARQQAARKRAARERLERIQRAQQEVMIIAAQREKRKKGDGATARASTTDPEARRMKMGDGGFRPAYNVELLTDLDSLVVAGANVTNAGNDAGQLEPMVQQVESQQTPLEPGTECYVDGDFAVADDIQSVSMRGVTVFAPVKKAARLLEAGKNPYLRHSDDQEYVGLWRERMGTPEAQEKYKQRSKTEFPNATCRNRGLYQFLVRGLKKVLSYTLWYVLTHDLFRRMALCAHPTVAAA